MRLKTRQTTNKVRFLMDDFLPPIIRDSRWFMALPMRLVLKRQAKLIMDFKDRSPFMTDEEIAEVYRQVEEVASERETDVNARCIDKITKSIVGKTVLDVGCGRGYLANILAEEYTVTGVDFVIDPNVSKRYPKVKFRKGSVEKLPFGNASFDTVTCTHTLEHVKQLEPALQELRRVAKRRLIIIVPMQRPYKYTFDLHLQFFPYPYVLLQAVGNRHKVVCKEVDGDLFLIEDYDRRTN